MDGRLIVRQGPAGLDPGRIFLLDRPETRLGRAGDNDIVVPDERTSRYHARVYWQDSSYYLEDLDSRNGTSLRGRRLEEPARLAQGDVISLPGLVLAFQSADSTDTVVDEVVTDLIVDHATGTVHVRGRRIDVTAKEFMALGYLFRRAGQLCSKDDIASQVWPEYGGNVGDYNVEQLVSRLRRKLEEDPQNPRYLVTVRGLGYRLLVT
jgi:DNA-binding response OmpR family regulator